MEKDCQYHSSKKRNQRERKHEGTEGTIHDRTIKTIVSLALVLCILGGLMPLTPDGGRALAYAEEAAGQITSGQWVYRLRKNGTAELIGHTNAGIKSLYLPAQVDGVWVTGLAEHAFAENKALTSVTIPASIADIPQTAFPAGEPTVSAYNGAAALAFAKERGLKTDNRSSYAFFSDVLDLSNMESSQWSGSGSQLKVEEPFARLIEAGKRLYLPADHGLRTGAAVKVESVTRQKGYATATVRDVDFMEVVREYHVENEPLYMDTSNMKILAEGFTLEKPSNNLIRKGSFSATQAISFNVDIQITKDIRAVGKLTYRPNLKVTFDYKSSPMITKRHTS